jgi:hypothetical protein
MTRKAEPPESLGLGKFEATPDGVAPTWVERARDYFLDRLAELAPHVMDELAGEPFELFKQTNLYFESDPQRIKRLERLDTEVGRLRKNKRAAELAILSRSNRPLWEVFEPGDEIVIAFEKAMRDWSIRHQLDARWLRERAYQTLDLWSADSKAFESRLWVRQIHFACFANETELVFRVRTRYPVYTQCEVDEKTGRVLLPKPSDSRSETERVIRKAFEKWLKQNLSALEADFQARAGNATPTPEKRAWHHFDWFIQWQVLGYSQSRIAREGKVDRKSVIDALNAIANLIGLHLRPAPSIKPKKK